MVRSVIFHMPVYSGTVEEFGPRKEPPARMIWNTKYVTGSILTGFVETISLNNIFIILISLIGSKEPIQSKRTVMEAAKFAVIRPMILIGKITEKSLIIISLSLNMRTVFACTANADILRDVPKMYPSTYMELMDIAR